MVHYDENGELRLLVESPPKNCEDNELMNKVKN